MIYMYIWGIMILCRYVYMRPVRQTPSTSGPPVEASGTNRSSGTSRASEARPASFRGKGCRGKLCRRGEGRVLPPGVPGLGMFQGGSGLRVWMMLGDGWW